jgi:hypothetical protein
VSDTRPLRPLSPVDHRFWEKVDQSGGPEACWPWRGDKHTLGYGVISRGRRGQQKHFYAHRVAFQIVHGPIPPDRPYVCHSCDNPPCCNPAHLFAGMHTKGRGTAGRPMAPITVQRGENHGQAKLTSEKVAAIREAAALGARQVDLAALYGVSAGNIAKVVKHETWSYRCQLCGFRGEPRHECLS